MRRIIKAHSLPTVSSSGIDYLMEDQVNALKKSFQDWYDTSGTDAKRRSRGKTGSPSGPSGTPGPA